MTSSGALTLLAREIAACTKCPRLVAWREQVAREKRARFRRESYWGRPVTGFGDARGRMVLVGLAPAAHGANRTGRIFTGDRSGDFLFAALHRVGLARQPHSVSKDDGQALTGVFLTCPVRCAPPDNMPLPGEVEQCAPFFDRELAALAEMRVLVALGAIAFRACLDWFARRGVDVGRPRPAFSHGGQVELGGYWLLGSYHVSQQNTQTGRLTEAMFDDVLEKAKRRAASFG